MFVESEQAHIQYRGYNPDFVRNAQAKRRQQEKQRQRAKLDEVRQAPPIMDEIPDNASVKQIIEHVAQRYGVTHDDITSMSRNPLVVAARLTAIAETRRIKPELTMPQIGLHFNRDSAMVHRALCKMGMQTASTYWAERR